MKFVKTMNELEKRVVYECPGFKNKEFSIPISNLCKRLPDIYCDHFEHIT